MKKEVVTEGPSVADAVDAALEELGVQQDAVEYEVVEEAGRGLFGLGSERGAKVRVWLKDAFLREIEDAKRVAREVLDVADEAQPAVAEPREEVGDEDIDRLADAAAEAIRSILGGFGVECTVDEYEGDYGEVILDVTGDDLAVLIGRHGRTLDALQVVVSAVAFRKSGVRYPLLVDVAGYRYRRKAKLDEIARRAAERVRRNGQPVSLRPMSSYERKVVHMALRDDPKVITASEGDEPFRKVVVSPR